MTEGDRDCDSDRCEGLLRHLPDRRPRLPDPPPRGSSAAPPHRAGRGWPGVQRADSLTRPGIITNQVIQLVADADLVVADLTDHNPNVFYELAIRHALQLPLVRLIDRAQDLPFDIKVMRTVPSSGSPLYQFTVGRFVRAWHAMPFT